MLFCFYRVVSKFYFWALLLSFTMPKGSELTEADRGKILGLRTGGSNISKISKTFKIPPSTVRDTIVRYMNSDNLKSARVVDLKA